MIMVLFQNYMVKPFQMNLKVKFSKLYGIMRKKLELTLLALIVHGNLVCSLLVCISRQT